MTRLLAITTLCLTLAGCNSYEEEYRTTLKQLEQTQQALAEAERRLKAANSEYRQKVFTLARRINRELSSNDPTFSRISAMADEMLEESVNYQPLSEGITLPDTLARFYHQKVAAILALHRLRDSAYDQGYNRCIGELNESGQKDALRIQLCEVQADLAMRDHQAELHATIKALQTVVDELLHGQVVATDLPTLAKLEARFDDALSRIKKQAS